MIAESKINKKVCVFGAYGHTGKFVVAELLRRGFTPVLSGRDRDKLATLGSSYPGLEIRQASVGNAKLLDAALTDCVATINCAGPFVDTAIPLIEAAQRMGVHYLDVAAEQALVLSIYEKFQDEKDIIIMPAVAFYGGLADLLATTAMGNWAMADSVTIGIALDSWLPTAGTRLTGARNTGKRLVYSEGGLVNAPDPLRKREWNFAEPFGGQDMIEFPLTEMLTISKHLKVETISTYINLKPMNDIHDAHTPPPEAADESGRSAQLFMMEVQVFRGAEVRKAQVSGRDIYAYTAPLIVEAINRIVAGSVKGKGVLSAGEAFDASDFLRCSLLLL